MRKSVVSGRRTLLSTEFAEDTKRKKQKQEQQQPDQQLLLLSTVDPKHRTLVDKFAPTKTKKLTSLLHLFPKVYYSTSPPPSRVSLPCFSHLFSLFSLFPLTLLLLSRDITHSYDLFHVSPFVQLLPCLRNGKREAWKLTCEGKF